MIEVQLEDLPRAEDEAIRKWLAAPGSKTCKRVVQAKVKKAQADALREALTSNPMNWKLEQSNGALSKAQFYQHFLDVFEELEQTAGPFHIAKVS